MSKKKKEKHRQIETQSEWDRYKRKKEVRNMKEKE